MEQSLISIIIPVYNGEKYLRPCIDSILHQTYKHWELLLIDDGSKETYQHWELLLIDDGSPDSSGAICDEYASDPRISVVHKENGGQASARNQGVAMAKGDYISFVDCDDWLETDMYESMLQTMQAQQAEIIICGYTEEYKERQKKVHADGEMVVYEATEAVKLVLQGKIGSYLWSMLFRREVVQERMPEILMKTMPPSSNGFLMHIVLSCSIRLSITIANWKAVHYTPTTPRKAIISLWPSKSAIIILRKETFYLVGKLRTVVFTCVVVSS